MLLAGPQQKPTLLFRQKAHLLFLVSLFATPGQEAETGVTIYVPVFNRMVEKFTEWSEKSTD
jgi:hypothetical protein